MLLAAPVPSVSAAHGVLRRLIGRDADRLRLEAIGPENGRDVFELQTLGDRIVVRGSSGVAIASGAYWYLKHYCHCDVSWCGDQLHLPDPLPAVEQKIRQATPFAYRYFFNYCTFSYTMAWWDWPEWERMIDWMALHGINMPLSVTGQEAIWQAVYRRMGLTDAEINQFFVGPAYLPFGWMGCMDGFGGPLTQAWIERHAELQKKIVARQRELGMRPVLQGFTGHVPAALKRKFPAARLQQLPSWCGFPGTWFVDPLDPLFREIGKAFVEEQTRRFGTDHLYASDTFIEMTPPSSEPQFLASMGRAIHGSMQAADPQAIWVLQGWIFCNNPKFWKPPQNRAFLTSVPDDRLILLDLFCDASPTWNRTEAFFGKPWVFCVLQTFGDVVGLHGGLKQTAENLALAMRDPQAGRLRGLGHTMEGLGCNPVVHDFLTDMTWRIAVPELGPWLDEYVQRRYGTRNAAALAAWKTLQSAVYGTVGVSSSLLCSRPSLKGVRGSGPQPRVAEAWKSLLDASDGLCNVDTYRFDLVNVSRQALGGLASRIHSHLRTAYEAKDRQALAEARQQLTELALDLDELLATRREFLLGRWVAAAQRWGDDDAERRAYAWNARNQITLWGPPDSQLHEYARKEWSGVVRGFYLRRWQRFCDQLDAALAAGKPFDAPRFEREIRQWEDAWTHGDEPYATEPRGNAIGISRRLWTKYGQRFSELDAKSLTTGRPVSCSHALADHPAGLANDGSACDSQQYWATDVKQDPSPWWQVDLEQPTRVGRVAVVFYYADRRYYGFTVETSLDGKTWQTVADRRKNQELSTADGFTLRFEPRPIRYLRVMLPHCSANTGRHLVEVMAFEK
jgi:alpha-N-acetylglucosaminidase